MKKVESSKSEEMSSWQMILSILESPIQILFSIVGVTALLLSLPFTYYSAVYAVHARKEAPPGYDFPTLGDFWVTAVATPVFAILDFFFYIVFTPICRYVCKEQKDLEQREQRSIKMANKLYRFCYFTGITAFGYYAVKDESYFPKALGGIGDFETWQDDFPYSKHNPLVRYKLHISLGFHTAMLLKLVFISEKRGDFIEMCLHDILTLYLYGGSYLVNIWETSIVIAFIHDASDVLLQMALVFEQTPHEIIAGIIFVSEMAVWLYMRIIVFPWVIWVSLKSPILDFKSQLIVPYFRFCLICLWVMHIYWFSIFVKIVLRPLTGGKMVDIRVEKKEDGKKEK